jgi:hypothetical protein
VAPKLEIIGLQDRPMRPETTAFPQEKQMKFLTALVLMGLAGVALVGCDDISAGSFGATTPNAPESSNRVIVYYMHRTVNCPDCLWIENTTRQTLKDAFPSELASGRLAFRQDLAKRYDVEGVSIVVVNGADGRDVSSRALEKVWDLKRKTAEFRAYIIEAVRAALNKAA